MTARGQTMRNVAFIGAGEATARLAQFLTVAVLGRALGPEGFAIVSVAWTLSLIFLPLAVEGPDTAGIRRFAQAPTPALFQEVIAAKLVFAVLGALAVAATGALLFYDNPALIGQAAAQACVILPFGLMTVWLLRAEENFAAVAFLRGFQAILFLAIITLVLESGGGVWAVPLAETAAGLMAAAAAIWITTRAGWVWPGLRATFAALLPGTAIIGREAFRIGLAAAAAAITWISVLPLAALFLPSHDVGMIGAALRLVLVLNSVAPLVLQVFFPRLARQAAGDQPPSGLLRPLLIIAALGASLAILLALAGSGFLIGLTFGPSYEGAVLPFEILVLTLFPHAVTAVLGNGLLATGSTGSYLAIMISGSISCLACTLLVLMISPGIHVVIVPMAIIYLQSAAFFILAWRRGLLKPRH